MLRVLPLLLALFLVPLANGQAQAPSTPRVGMVPGGSTAAGAPVDSGGASWLRPIASALMPGAGQFISGHDRGAIYLVVEALLVTRFIIFHNEGRRERDRFRELAFTVARAPFTPTVRDTVFEYFEQLGKFIESGGFDTDTGPNLVPPTDERTFNGSIWALAQRIFFADPDNPPDPDSEEFRRALKFYEQRAVGPNFQWSWRNAGLEQDLFRRSIRQSDEAFRRATQQLGLLLANHLLSALDAFISQRLSQNNRQVALASALWHPGEGRGLQWVMMVQVGF